MNSEIVYAVLYARRRLVVYHPWTLSYEGQEYSGIYKSVDGGATWRKLTKGLRTRTGRIGLSVFPGKPSIIYSVVEGLAPERSGVFLSDDAGESWRFMNGISQFPMYFGQIRVDPSDAKRVYNLYGSMLVSEDSGQTFSEHASTKVHPDFHALWIDPADSRHLLVGSDGGLFRSRSKGLTWDYLNRFPAMEVYSVSVDHSTPYRICAGTQDNFTWWGTAVATDIVGIRNEDWHLLGFGDGSHCVFDAVDRDVWYTVRGNLGTLFRSDPKAGTFTDITWHVNGQAIQTAGALDNQVPLIGSTHDSTVMFIGGVAVRSCQEVCKWRQAARSFRVGVAMIRTPS